MRYKYVATTGDGLLKRGEIEAPELAEALEALRAQGLIPLEVKPTRRSLRLRIFASKKQEDLLLFTEQLERLLASGVSVDRALGILTRVFKATGKVFLAEITEDLKRKLEQGESLSTALAESGVFPEFYVSLVKAGEISGALPEVLADLCRYLREERNFRRELQSALLYPAFLVIFGLIAVQTVLVYILPRFGVIFDEIGVEPPLITRILLKVGSFWHDWGWLFLVALLALFFFLRWYVRKPEGRKKTEKILLRLPFFGPLFFLADMARTFRGLAVMVKGGVSIPQALSLAARIPSFHILKGFFLNAAQELKEGARLPRLFSHFPGNFDFVVNFISLGEETGDMAQAFEDMAFLCEEEVKVASKRFLTIIEPVTILFFGLLLGGMIISILLAIFDIRLGV
ncbi:type II secretion system F family protein [Thermodesulfatator atlanticus]|uniref:type II secretion system F family protein n=1 Tax=Thermodesulfatator atlanticus TaxID=501497 RepID=UPI0003B5A6E0|nr:type II secretion system F family protein [Thermodesulfatator atlanticus]